MEKDASLPASNIDPTSSLLPASPSSDEPVIPSQLDPLLAQANPLSTQPGDPEEEPYLSLSVDTLGFAGILLVKTEDELGRVKRVGVGKILAGIGRRPLNVILGGKKDRT